MALEDQIFDVAVIGGGINGCGCAADAASRGLSVVLFEEDDLASKTSSASSKLIHGGLRYLENYEFGLVKKALTERQTLLELAPYLIKPLSFVLPYQQQARPVWLLRTGLFLYDYLSRNNKLPHTQFIRRTEQSSVYFSPLKKIFQKGFIYYDCATDDARLTIANALQAQQYGANIQVRTTVTAASQENQLWKLQLSPQHGTPFSIKAKSVINAAGPWVNEVNQHLGIVSQEQLSLVKGSHLVVPKLYTGNHAYLLQNEDKRIVFTIPYHGYTLIGTTEVQCTKPQKKVSIDSAEIQYLCKIVANYFDISFNPEAILHAWSGTRPLLASEKHSTRQLSRDYTYYYSSSPAPAITIYGGKITTYRQLSAAVVDQLKTVFPSLPASKTHQLFLPGVQLEGIEVVSYQTYLEHTYPWLDNALKYRFMNTYGTLAESFLAGCQKGEDLGEFIIPGLSEKEIQYLCQKEWAKTSEDILWRRTKLGLNTQQTDWERLSTYLTAS